MVPMDSSAVESDRVEMALFYFSFISQTETINRGKEICTGRKPRLFVGCLTSQQQASVSQGRICSDKFTCCHTEIEVADQTFYLTQSQYTDTGPTSPRRLAG